MNQQYLVDQTLNAFSGIVKKHQLFHLSFACFGIFFCFLFFFLYSTLAESYLIAICIACLFFFTVTYFVLRLYFQQEKPRKLYELSEKYLSLCKEEQGSHAIVGSYLEEIAAKISNLPPVFPFTFGQNVPWLIKFFYLPDLYLMKEIFLLSSVEEYLEMVKKSPTAFEAHASLAKAYGLLADLYKNADFDDLRYAEKYRQCLVRAIEELKILKEFAPETLWARKQLACHYQSLNMAENEIEEYEAICALCPHDSSSFVTLGKIYFQQGKTGKGLKIYEELKGKDPILAGELLHFYGSSQVLTKNL
jgi:hypothetical protein